MTLEVLYFDGCPNHERVLERLPRLLEDERVAAQVVARQVCDEEQAQRERFLGSPTVRVDGCDVERGATARTDFGLKCRIYRTSQGLAGTPPDEWIVDALRGLRAEQ